MLHYETIPVTAFHQNCSLVWEDEGMTAAVIDPGGDTDVLLAACKQLGITLTYIWITRQIWRINCNCPSSGRTRATSFGLTVCPWQRPLTVFLPRALSSPRAGWPMATRSL